jgi:hypothetical protein
MCTCLWVYGITLLYTTLRLAGEDCRPSFTSDIDFYSSSYIKSTHLFDRCLSVSVCASRGWSTPMASDIDRILSSG